VLNEKLKKIIQTAYSRILESKNIKPRYGQRLMIADIARTLGNINKNDLNQPHICTLEAGTGTGKTIAYCVAALPIAKEQQKKLIISTATIALQEQILMKDLPEIQQHSGLNFSFTLAKGRKRYVCLQHLHNYISQKENNNIPLFSATEDHNLLNNKNDIILYETLHQAFNKHRWDGERDSWNEVITDSSWYPLTSDPHQCSGKRCSFYDECVFYKAREAVFKVDCIVANHDLVLSDLNMGGGIILPPPDECIYIFDEGHHLPAKAINHFQFSLKVNATQHWLEQTVQSLNNFNDLAKPSGHIQRIIKHFPQQVKDTGLQLEQLKLLLNQFKFPPARQVNTSAHQPRDEVYRFKFGVIPDELQQLCQHLLQLFVKIFQQLDTICMTLKDCIDGNNKAIKSEYAEQWLPVIVPLQNRAEVAVALLEIFTSKDRDGAPPHARWLKKSAKADETDIEIACSPILAAKYLQHILWSRCYAAVVTSATITALGKFDRYILDSGVPGEFDILPSPFNYQQNVEFVVPSMNSEATQYQAHTDEIIKLLPEIIDSNKGTLVLFSSRRQMNDVEYELFRQEGKWKHLILTQGQSNKQAIITEHKKQIDQGQGSVIFGLASFSEGIDLPGKYCEHVIIAKLPFSVPDDPVDASLTEWLESQGRNAFLEISVPDASIKLIQACGRLIRKETDKGRITLLDKRIITKFYGQQILNALPPYKKTLNQPVIKD
jgi:ATP-dependent DNA helicase DinG